VVGGENMWLGVETSGWGWNYVTGGRNKWLGLEIHDWRVQIRGLGLKRVVRGETCG
jgi:hypothetical protein